jgi:hypothetical protein
MATLELECVVEVVYRLYGFALLILEPKGEISNEPEKAGEATDYILQRILISLLE